jgi:hypothetical protein
MWQFDSWERDAAFMTPCKAHVKNGGHDLLNFGGNRSGRESGVQELGAGGTALVEFG